MNSPQILDIYILAPINFKHRAGDGMKTRERRLTNIVPALQSNCGETQCPYVLEVRACQVKEN